MEETLKERVIVTLEPDGFETDEKGRKLPAPRYRYVVWRFSPSGDGRLVGQANSRAGAQVLVQEVATEHGVNREVEV